MASFLIYNGVKLHLTKTNAYRQEPVYSEDGVDLIGVRVVLDVDATYAPGAMSYRPVEGDYGFTLAEPFPGVIAPITDTAVSAALLQPRAKLQYVVGNVVVINSPADGYAIDINNGPTPKFLETTRITERSWRVSFRIETTIRDCPANSSGLLSSRWNQVETIGSDRLSTIYTRGISVFRTDRLAELDVTADAFRSICLPPFIRNFQRIQQTVSLNEIGNILTWEIVDRERYVSLGQNTAATYGVVDFTGALTVSTVPAGEAGIASEYCVANFECTVKGGRTSSRLGLLSFAHRLAVEKLAIPPPGAPVDAETNPMLLKVVGGEQIDSPVVSVMFSVKLPPAFVAQGAFGGMNMGLLGYDPGAFRLGSSVAQSVFYEGLQDGTNPQLPNGTRATHRGMLLSQVIRPLLGQCSGPEHPVCTQQVGGYGPGDADNAPVGPGDYLCGTGTFINVGVGPPIIPTSENAYSDGQKSGHPYSEAKVETTHTRRSNRVISPVAGDGTEEALVFELANPLDIRTATWTSERTGVKPRIPAPESLDENEVVLHSEIHASAPEVAPDGKTPIYRASGEYVYGQRHRRGPGQGGLAMGRGAYTAFPYAAPGATIEEADYRHGLTGPPASTPSVPPVDPPDYPPA